MTRALTPALRNVGIDNGVRIGKGAGTVPPFAENLWHYNYSGREESLEEAKKQAESYLKTQVYAKNTKNFQDEEFVNQAFFPQWITLLDLYETTKDKKYLDAAVEAAGMNLAVVWSQSKIPEGNITLDGEKVLEFAMKRRGEGLFFKGDIGKRTGVPENNSLVKTETVPGWVVSNVGLGIEQISTFKGGTSSNILMNTYAADLIRLSKYSGKDIFETFARNMMLGRFTNYPGYYLNQYSAYQMRPEYPYTGPDLNGIYYHHAPVLWAAAQDFLISQAWKWSDERIHFPYVRQLGYVWFNNRHYGFEKGTFFNEKDMWLWMKEGLVKADNIQIDWIGARKDGVFAFALMNEDTEDIETTVALGNEVTGGKEMNGTAVVYDSKGNESTVKVNQGKIKVAIPAHGLIGIKVNTPNVKEPEFAKISPEDYKTAPVGMAVAKPQSEDDFGNGLIVQVTPDEYFAYVYATFSIYQVKKAVLHYRIGDGDWNEVEKGTYPFEFTITVPDVNKCFEYYMEVEDLGGNIKKSEVKVLKSLAAK
jgi:hypothetical protein